jgi:hypothetical protein
VIGLDVEGEAITKYAEWSEEKKCCSIHAKGYSFACIFFEVIKSRPLAL